MPTPKNQAAHAASKKTNDVPPITESVDVRMYCMGTGDCFVLKFNTDGRSPFTMMIDCGSCQVGPNGFELYIQNLAEWVGATHSPAGKWSGGYIDLLVVTHEHNDHVNGFVKCLPIFEGITFGQAWFAWTENPNDPDGKAQELQKKRTQMRKGLEMAMNKLIQSRDSITTDSKDDFYNTPVKSAMSSYLEGLQSVGGINLNDSEKSGNQLAGMKAIKELLVKQKTPIKYVIPGNTLSFTQIPDVNFHVLGPPLDQKYIYKDGKEGKDVYKRYFSIGDTRLAMNTFANLDKVQSEADLPFGQEYVWQTSDGDLLKSYNNPVNKWRTIENDWLQTAGSLAIRLDSHINNTSVALAIEIGVQGKVLLFPGDAEFGSWESWHLIEKWSKAGNEGQSFAESLLNRTLFYKVSHHLSYNGTALEKGIKMMNNPGLASMVTLDRNRISTKWTKTMPNIPLLGELIKRCEGRCFIMDEFQIENPPSAEMDLATLKNAKYQVIMDDANTNVIAKQYSVII